MTGRPARNGARDSCRAGQHRGKVLVRYVPKRRDVSHVLALSSHGVLHTDYLRDPHNDLGILSPIFLPVFPLFPALVFFLLEFCPFPLAHHESLLANPPSKRPCRYVLAWHTKAVFVYIMLPDCAPFAVLS